MRNSGDEVARWQSLPLGSVTRIATPLNERVFMRVYRTTMQLVLLALTVSLGTPAFPSDQTTTTQQIDRSVRPGDDFYRYANGAWLATTTIPAGQSVYDTRAILVERTSGRVRDLIQGAAAAHAASG